MDLLLFVFNSARSLFYNDIYLILTDELSTILNSQRLYYIKPLAFQTF